MVGIKVNQKRYFLEKATGPWIASLEAMTLFFAASWSQGLFFFFFSTRSDVSGLTPQTPRARFVQGYGRPAEFSIR